LGVKIKGGEGQHSQVLFPPKATLSEVSPAGKSSCLRGIFIGKIGEKIDTVSQLLNYEGPTPLLEEKEFDKLLNLVETNIYRSHKSRLDTFT
jgi:hypothetical protein